LIKQHEKQSPKNSKRISSIVDSYLHIPRIKSFLFPCRPTMKILTTFILFITILLYANGQSKTLGDWASFHREADNLCKDCKYEDAVKLYRQVIKGRLPFQGNQHRDVGVTWNNLGVALYFSGENERAKEAYEKAIKVLLPAIGAQHPDLLTVNTNLAFIEETKNNYKQAEKSFRELLRKKLPLVGANHTDLADCQEGLALALEGQEKHEEALELLKSALKIREEKLGENHTDVGATYAAMTIIYLNQGEFDEANKYDEKARKVLAKTKGTYVHNLNTVSRLRPQPAEIMKAKSKDLRIP
jgi:tetratricopeptide (TPR) repeat protein